MLIEQEATRQIKGEPHRRWFVGDELDLIVWHDEADGLVGFQLCYDLTRDAKAVTWIATAGFSHTRIDSGDDKPGKIKASPVTERAIPFDGSEVVAAFERQSAALPAHYRAAILEKLRSESRARS